MEGSEKSGPAPAVAPASSASSPPQKKQRSSASSQTAGAAAATAASNSEDSLHTATSSLHVRTRDGVLVMLPGSLHTGCSLLVSLGENLSESEGGEIALGPESAAVTPDSLGTLAAISAGLVGAQPAAPATVAYLRTFPSFAMGRAVARNKEMMGRFSNHELVAATNAAAFLGHTELQQLLIGHLAAMVEERQAAVSEIIPPRDDVGEGLKVEIFSFLNVPRPPGFAAAAVAAGAPLTLDRSSIIALITSRPSRQDPAGTHDLTVQQLLDQFPPDVKRAPGFKEQLKVLMREARVSVKKDVNGKGYLGFRQSDAGIAAAAGGSGGSGGAPAAAAAAAAATAAAGGDMFESCAGITPMPRDPAAAAAAAASGDGHAVDADTVVETDEDAEELQWDSLIELLARLSRVNLAAAAARNSDAWAAVVGPGCKTFWYAAAAYRFPQSGSADYGIYLPQLKQLDAVSEEDERGGGRIYLPKVKELVWLLDDYICPRQDRDASIDANIDCVRKCMVGACRAFQPIVVNGRAPFSEDSLIHAVCFLHELVHTCCTAKHRAENVPSQLYEICAVTLAASSKSAAEALTACEAQAAPDGDATAMVMAGSDGARASNSAKSSETAAAVVWAWLQLFHRQVYAVFAYLDRHYVKSLAGQKPTIEAMILQHQTAVAALPQLVAYERTRELEAAVSAGSGNLPAVCTAALPPPGLATGGGLLGANGMVETVRAVAVGGETLTLTPEVAATLPALWHLVACSPVAHPIVFLHGDCEAPILSRVLDYCTALLRKEREQWSEERWAEFNARFVDVEQGTLFKMILVANQLHADALNDLLCKAVADMIKGKTPEEIRTHFNIRNDFTPEEEEEVRRENAWCEDI
eukprot:SAG22_NODE_299_length_12768_cov_11.369426_5_plen_866_part_00